MNLTGIILFFFSINNTRRKNSFLFQQDHNIIFLCFYYSIGDHQLTTNRKVKTRHQTNKNKQKRTTKTQLNIIE